MAGNIFKNVPIDVPNKSGHDLSHSNSLTTKCGTITPILCDFLIPGDSVDLSMTAEVSLPPMATDFYGRIQGKIEAFFVPCRILWAGWKNFLFSHTSDNVKALGDIPQFLAYIKLLRGSASEAEQSSLSPDGFEETGPGTLADFLGLKFDPSLDKHNIKKVNALPFLAYHKIWNDWYRNSKIQKPCFIPYSYENSITNSVSSNSAAFAPYIFDYSISGASTIKGFYEQTLADGTYVSRLRQRNWDLDYFTAATLEPQSGDPSTLAFSVTDSAGSFTISSLRAANSLQQWLERNNIGGFQYPDTIKAQYGVMPSDAITNRAIYLGRMNFDVYTKGVFQQSNNAETGSVSTQNPFTSVGSKYGDTKGFGDGSLVNRYDVTEHGFLFVNFTLTPDATYSSGTRKYLLYEDISDVAFPLLQGVGDQPIVLEELTGMSWTAPGGTNVFGYTQRYAEYKNYLDEVHGLLVDGQSLASFALQRNFSLAESAPVPKLGSEFIEIPTDYLDQVGAVSTDISNFGCWCNFWFNYKKVSTLAAYSIPTLGDMRNTHVEHVQQGGRML